MIRYVRHAVPWVTVACAAGMTAVLLAVLSLDPWTLWPLEAVAIGVLGGAAAWCFDESSAVVVDVAPRGLGWRTAARTLAVTALGVWWCAAVAIARGSLFGHPWHVATQGMVALLIGGTWATWRRSRGRPAPGFRFAMIAVPCCAAWGLIRPAAEALPLFPYTPLPGPWQSSMTLWSVAAAVSVLGGVAALHRRW